MSIISDQPLSTKANIGQTTPDAPKTWTFIDSDSGELLTVTCMPGCESDHSGDIETPTHRDDIWCQAHTQSATLPINDNGTPEETHVLSATLNVRPFDRNLNARMPLACVEIMQDAWIEDLDPDAFEHVINTLQSQVDALRRAHAELIRARAVHKGNR